MQYKYSHSNKNPNKGEGLPITGHEGTEEQFRYSSTFSLTSALDGGGVDAWRHVPAALPR